MKSAGKKSVEKRFNHGRRVSDMARLFNSDKDIKEEIKKETAKSVDARLHILETKFDHIDKVMDGRGQVLLQLSKEHAGFGVEMESLRGAISTLEDNITLSIERHMKADAVIRKTEAEGRAIQARRAYWALMTILFTSVAAFGAAMLERLGFFLK